MTRYGCETPRLFTPPLRELTPETSWGFAAIEFAEDVLGMSLLPWQKWLLVHMLELRPDGRPRFRTVIILIARQNGKSTISQVLALFWLFVLRVALVLGTAQNLDIAEEVWSLAVDLAESVPELAAEMDGEPIMAAGKKTLVLTEGRRYKVQSANRRGGRSLSADRVLLDELREHTKWDAWAAVTKTTMAKPHAMVVGLSNAGDDYSIVLNYEREIGLRTLTGDGPTDFALFEWSAPDGCDLDDRDAWAQANPSMGWLITEESIESARHSDPEQIFRTEVLCQKVDQLSEATIPRWPSRYDAASKLEPGATVAFAVDVSWDRSRAWIAAVGQRPDGTMHAEIVATGEGTDWVESRIATLAAKWNPVAIGWQENGAPVSSVPICEDGHPLKASDVAKGCGKLFDAIREGSLVHAGQEPLDDAAKLSVIKAFGDGWLFDRKKSPVDAAPILAVAEALWLLSTVKPKPKRRPPRRLR